MPSVTFRLQQPGDTNGFRISLAGANGELLTPRNALSTHKAPGPENAGIQKEVMWAYGVPEVEYHLSPGTYSYVASSGPTYAVTGADVTVRSHAVQVDVVLHRHESDAVSGWVAADDHTHVIGGKQPDHLVEICGIEGIDFCGIQYWGSYTGGDTSAVPPTAEGYRDGGIWVSTDQEVEMHSPWGPWEDTSVVGLKEMLPDLRQDSVYRMNAVFYREAKARGCGMVVYQSPVWAQFPVDVALGLVDSVNLCDNYFSVSRPQTGPWSHPQFDPADDLQNQPFGIARWVFGQYYRVLNAGFRIPASGGSAFPRGGGGGPVGMGRFYIQTGENPSPETYFQRWKEGRTFATNGPLLLAKVNGARPSSTPLTHRDGLSTLELHAFSNRPINRLEWVADGEIIASRELTNPNRWTEETWQTEVDLSPHRWVAARCFGESERTLYPEAGGASPPFLIAHTSPVYFTGQPEAGPTQKEAAGELLEQVEWMGQVIRGAAAAPFAVPYASRDLNEAERQEIYGLLEEARSVYQRLI